MSYSKDLYATLGLAAPTLHTQDLSAQDLKAAYKKALFEAHPDKKAGRQEVEEKKEKEKEEKEKEEKEEEELAVKAAAPNQNGARQARADKAKYTVDEVREAYAVLSDPRQRGVYDAWFERRVERGFGEGGVDFLAGLEVLDLGDFEVVGSSPVAASGVGAAQGLLGCGDEEVEMEWRRACRCGNARGFGISEAQLEGAEREGRTEVVVQCWGCSVCVRVGFAVEEG